MVFVTGGADADLDAAIRMIEGMIVEPEVGKIYRGCVVKKVVEFGCFVEYLPGLEGLVHISELDVSRVPNVSDVTSEGAVMDVKIIAVDNRGKNQSESQRSFIGGKPRTRRGRFYVRRQRE